MTEESQFDFWQGQNKNREISSYTIAIPIAMHNRHEANNGGAVGGIVLCAVRDEAI
jgi:hypothetical protein